MHRKELRMIQSLLWKAPAHSTTIVLGYQKQISRYPNQDILDDHELVHSLRASACTCWKVVFCEDYIGRKVKKCIAMIASLMSTKIKFSFENTSRVFVSSFDCVNFLIQEPRLDPSSK